MATHVAELEHQSRSVEPDFATRSASCTTSGSGSASPAASCSSCSACSSPLRLPAGRDQHEHYHTLAEATASRSCRSCPTAASSSTATASCSRRTTPPTRWRSRRRNVKNLDDTIEELATLVEITPRDRRRFKKLLEEAKNFESLPIRTRLTDEEIARFAANRYRFPGVEIKARLFRQYPYGELSSHVIGHIGRINQKDVDRLEAGATRPTTAAPDYIGKTGLEHSYERELHGTTGVEQVEVDSGGRAVRTLVAHAADLGQQSGAHARHQAAAGRRSALRRSARRAGRDRAAAPAACSPSCRKPGFDPEPLRRRHRSAELGELNDSPDKPMLNRALRGTYPPGSTFKPFMALAALTSGKRTPSQTIFDPGLLPASGSHTVSATTSPAATARSTCTSRSSCRATPTTTCSRTTSTSTPSRAS